MTGATEHKGLPLVRVQAPRTRGSYLVPEAYASLPIADIIRRLFQDELECDRDRKGNRHSLPAGSEYFSGRSAASDRDGH